MTLRGSADVRGRSEERARCRHSANGPRETEEGALVEGLVVVATVTAAGAEATSCGSAEAAVPAVD